MPIKPENRGRYPADWPAIRERIRARSGGRCECLGECGDAHDDRPGGRCAAPHGVLIYRHRAIPAVWRAGYPAMLPEVWRDQVRVVLTVAHLDHRPENNEPGNLRHYCQRCHNRYDAPHRARNAAETRQRRRIDAGLLELPFNLAGSKNPTGGDR